MRTRLLVVGLFGIALASVSAQQAVTGSATGRLLVANSNDTLHREKGPGYVAVYDPATGKRLATIPNSGTTAHEVTASPDGRFAYVPIFGNGGVGMPGSDGRTLDIVDVKAGKTVGTIDFGKGVRPHFVAVGKDGLLYVTTEIDQTVTIVDPNMRKIVGTIPTGSPESHFVVVSSDGRRGYTANVYTGTVSVLDLQARKLLTTIPVAPAKDPAAKRVWRTQRLAMSPDDKTVYTCDWITSELVAIDTTSNTVRARAKISAPCYSIAATPDGRFALAAARDSKKLAVVDVHAMKTVREIDVPATPQQVILRPDGQMAFVSCDQAQKVVAIRTSDWGVERTIDTGYWPDGLSWAAGN